MPINQSLSPARTNPHINTPMVQSYGGVNGPFTTNTAGALTYTVQQLLSGLILRDGNGGARTDTLPTAAQIVSGYPGLMVNDGFRFNVRNMSSTAIAITIAVGAGGTLSTGSTATVAQLNAKDFLILMTNVTPGSEAYTVYSLGTWVF